MHGRIRTKAVLHSSAVSDSDAPTIKKSVKDMNHTLLLHVL